MLLSKISLSRISRLLSRSIQSESRGPFLRAFSLAAAYGLWTALFRLLILTFVTYFLLPGEAHLGNMPPAPLPRFEEITDILGANELPLLGFSAVLFIILLLKIQPLTSTTLADIVDAPGLKRRFAPGLLHGTTFAAGVILAFLIGGSYEYLGLYLQFDELALTFPSILLRVTAIVVFIYSEEFLFRRKILEQLQAGFSSGSSSDQNRVNADLLAAALTGLLYCAIKAVQFELGLMQLLTIFLLSVALGLQSTRSGDFSRGAGFWAALLVIFHVAFSLPVFGTDFSGLFLVKYQAAVDGALDQANTTRLLSGGVGGPLSGLALQILLVIELGRSLFRRRKHFRTPAPTS